MIGGRDSLDDLALLVTNEWFHPLTCGNDACNMSRGETLLHVHGNQLACWACPYTQSLEALDAAKTLIRSLASQPADGETHSAPIDRYCK